MRELKKEKQPPMIYLFKIFEVQIVELKQFPVSKKQPRLKVTRAVYTLKQRNR